MKLKRFTTQLVAAGLIAVPLAANAAGLGKLSVTSALGQPLAAEIELFAADKAELDSLAANLASEQAFRDARVEFAPVLSSLRFTVVKKPNGKAVLKVSTARPVNDPFIDMLVELNWASGRLVREYTMLLDPPGRAVTQTVSPVVIEQEAPPAQAAPEPASTAALAPEAEAEPAVETPVLAETQAPAGSEPTAQGQTTEPPPAAETQAVAEAEPVTETQAVAETEPAAEKEPVAEKEPAAETQAETEPAPESRAVADAEPAAESKPAARAAAAAGIADDAAAPDRVKVKRGDTLSGIASRVRPEGVSLEQTLMALFRENPKAFSGNVNRLKAGKTLTIPPAEKAAAIPQQEAVRELKLQAADWRAYRQKLASAVAAAPEAQPASGQAASGTITPKVEDAAEPAADAQQDVLKLSNAAAATPDAKAGETQRAQDPEADAAAREKALEESGERVALLEKQVEDIQKLAAMKEQGEAAAPEAAESAPPAEAIEPPPAPELEAQPEPDPALAPAVDAPQAAPQPAENWYDPVLADPLYWGGGLAVLGLGGVLWWMMASGGRRRKAGLGLDDAIVTSGDLRPSAAGAASGGSVNTGDSSFLTDFSQAGLGAIDTHDVDPIAEAEVYMAYGRDAQAEEILREAIGKTPDRHEIRIKLLEIYAARRNAAAFEAAAGELYAALGSKPSPLWDKACEMGRNIDPTNPLYGSAATAAKPVAVAATAAVAGGAVAFADEPVVPKSLAVKPAEPAPARIEPEPVFAAVASDSPLDFESAGNVLDFEKPVAAAAPAANPVETDTQGLKFELPDLDIPAASPSAKQQDAGFDDDKYDFSGFDLDLGGAVGSDLDEVGTKLDLARAYVEMGDKEGAREILSEVLAEGNESQKADAKGILSALG